MIWPVEQILDDRSKLFGNLRQKLLDKLLPVLVHKPDGDQDYAYDDEFEMYGLALLICGNHCDGEDDDADEDDEGEEDGEATYGLSLQELDCKTDAICLRSISWSQSRGRGRTSLSWSCWIWAAGRW